MIFASAIVAVGEESTETSRLKQNTLKSVLIAPPPEFVAPSIAGIHFDFLYFVVVAGLRAWLTFRVRGMCTHLQEESSGAFSFRLHKVG